jgi:hypothetical protein
MNFRNYTIDLDVNGSLLEIAPGSFSFSVRDSIYKFYSEMDFTFNDPTGLYLEYQLFSPGIPVKLSYGFDSEVLVNSFISNNWENPKDLGNGYVNGDLKSSLVHSYLAAQEKKSSSYNGSPSSIITELFDETATEFSSTLIDSSKNIRSWLRPFVNQQHMIESVFLENVYSNDSNETPFFTFIDSNNQFHFESFHTMMERSPAAELELSSTSPELGDRNKLYSFKPFTDNFSTMRNYFNREIDIFSPKDFSITKEELHIDEIYPGIYPMIGDSSKFQGQFWFDEPQPEDFDYKGRRLFQFRKGLLPQKALITLPLNTKLTSGNTVDLFISSANSGVSSSFAFSDRFLIESSDHIWSGASQTGYSQLLLGRKTMNIPDDYLVKENFYQK